MAWYPIAVAALAAALAAYPVAMAWLPPVALVCVPIAIESCVVALAWYPIAVEYVPVAAAPFPRKKCSGMLIFPFIVSVFPLCEMIELFSIVPFWNLGIVPAVAPCALMFPPLLLPAVLRHVPLSMQMSLPDVTLIFSST